MTANDIAQKYATSPKVRGLLASHDFIGVVKEIRNDNNCTLKEAKEAADILRGTDLYGKAMKLFTQSEVDEMIVRNAISRLTLTPAEEQAFRRKGLID